MLQLKNVLLIAAVITIIVWLTTFFVGLTMMWDREWMTGDPLSERINGILHWVAVTSAIGLGLSLIFRRVRQNLAGLQLTLILLALIIGLVSIVARVGIATS